MRPIMGQGRKLRAAGRRAMLTAAPLALLAGPAQAAASDPQLTSLAFQNGSMVVLSALACGGEALVVWGGDCSGPFSYNGGDEQLQSCLKGADALALSSAIDGLSDRGDGLCLTVPDRQGRLLGARGRAVGGMAAVWLEEPQAPV